MIFLTVIYIDAICLNTGSKGRKAICKMLYWYILGWLTVFLLITLQKMYMEKDQQRTGIK